MEAIFKLSNKVLNNIDQIIETQNIQLITTYEEEVITKSLDISEVILYTAVMFKQQEILREIDKMLDFYKGILNKTRFDNVDITKAMLYTPTKRFEPIEINDDPTKFKFTYLMRCNYSKQIKIGVSKNIVQREATLNSVNPDINVLNIVPLNIELDLHKKYLGERSRGEWFKLTKPQIKELIFFFNRINSYIWKQLIFKP